MDRNIPAAPESVALLKALARALQGLHVFLEGLAPRAGRAVGEVEADVKKCMTPATKQVDTSRKTATQLMYCSIASINNIRMLLIIHAHLQAMPDRCAILIGAVFHCRHQHPLANHP